MIVPYGCYTLGMHRHILQSAEWSRFKNEYGTPSINAGGVFYTKHKIPFSSYFYAYSPRVNPFDIDFEALSLSLKENSCVAVQFDVPNITKDSSDYDRAQSIFEKRCVLSSRDEFAKGNFLLDLSFAKNELFEKLHKKHRYNIKYALKRGVICRKGTDFNDFEIFYKLYKSTAERQKYFFRSQEYLESIWNIFGENEHSHILIVEHEGTPLASWLLIDYEGVLYYPYGGSSVEKRNLHAGCVIGWEAIKLGKSLGCNLFDMWGASEDMNNKKDSYYGFSVFKQKFGGKHVVYIDSYDFVVNKSLYKAFILANDLRWKILGLLR
jgi:lipid II:glycine glycyltransferase (peptidoglycan interpeptide bridge formation enzyme)